jgi:hypothetical protein
VEVGGARERRRCGHAEGCGRGWGSGFGEGGWRCEARARGGPERVSSNNITVDPWHEHMGPSLGPSLAPAAEAAAVDVAKHL